MPIPTSLTGLSHGPIVHEVDSRWTMAYAAALGDHHDHYLDTTRPAGLVAHPLFPVCPEWPVIVASRELSEAHGVTREEVITGVHATHDLTVHRLVRPGDVLRTTLEIVGVVDKSPGALSTTRLKTVDAAGQPVATTTQDGFYLGVPAEGPDRPDPTPPPALDATDRRGDPTQRSIALSRGAAHIYTECARIWNPIHTDVAVAHRAGLDDIILHGTANLAYGVSAALDAQDDNRPDRVRRIVGRFAAMVAMPSTITVNVWAPNDAGDTCVVPFEVLNEHGQPAVRDGFLVLGN